MLSTSTALHLMCLICAADAAQLIKVPFTSTLGGLSLTKSVADITNFQAPAGQKTDGPVTNAVLKVVVSVQAGDEQTFNDVLLDTGSNVLWVGAQDPYRPGRNTEPLNENFSVGYGAGGVNGTAYKDRVAIGNAIVNSQIIGSADHTSGFTLVKPIDGILGLGPAGSNAGQVSGFNTTPNFVETLVSEGCIDEPVFGIYVSPLDASTGNPSAKGEITFGGVDESRISGNVTWIPQRVESQNFHWEFDVSSFSWGNVELVNSTTFTRTDTGVLSIAIPIDAFIAIRDLVNGTFDNSPRLSGFLAFPPNATADSLPPLSFVLGGTTFSIPPSQYLVPKALYPSLNITDNLTHSWIASGGFGAFQFGQKWLEAVYSAYDMANHRIGFAHLS